MLGQNDDEDDLREVHSQTREADSDCFKTAPAYWGRWGLYTQFLIWHPNTLPHNKSQQITTNHNNAPPSRIIFLELSSAGRLVSCYLPSVPS